MKKIEKKVKSANNKGLSIWGTQLASKAKRANQRLRQLEKSDLASNGAYNYAKQLGVSNKYVGKSKDGKLKFTTQIKKMSDQEAKEFEQYVDIFLQSKSSTVKGYKELHNQNRKAYEESTGKPLTDEDWNYIWSSAVMRNLSRLYSSDSLNSISKTLKTSNMDHEEAQEFLTMLIEVENKDTIDNVEDLKTFTDNNSLAGMSFEDMEKQFINKV